MNEHYVLNDDHSVRPAELLEWAAAFNDTDKRRVARDELDGVSVSTVFLGLDHSFGEGPPLIFETLIFGGKLDQEMWRYSTWDEAVAGHKHAVAQAIEAQRAGTTKIGPVEDESAVAESDAHNKDRS
jgi:hypothetical protein